MTGVPAPAPQAGEMGLSGRRGGRARRLKRPRACGTAPVAGPGTGAAVAPHCAGNLHTNITVNVLSALARGVIE